ncbi:MAG TPA: DUF362 domain-containing protein [Verrucomicrobiae bacterium]|nr:DUF362 domain-containing protein [Verrucomicrobiae bacterium]
MSGCSIARRAAALLLITLGGNSFAGSPTNTLVATGPKSRVVLVRDPSAVKGFNFDAAKVCEMVATGMTTLTGKTDEADAWRVFVSSNDVVGIKINTIAAPLQVTRHEVVDAIVAGLQRAGVATTNIIIWDRDALKMGNGGYKINRDGPGPRVLSVVPDTGYDPDAFFESKLVGRLIWGDLGFGTEEALSTQSHFPKLVTRTITKLINVPVLMDNDSCGLMGCLYNVSLGAVDNSRRFEGMVQGSTAPAEICAMPWVRRTLVLNIADALVGSYAGGPAFKPQYSWPYGGLYFSRDPVAVDALCLELIDAKRKTADVPDIGDRAAHVTVAPKLGLGHAERGQIELIEVAP